jgi:hypothetical protein
VRGPPIKELLSGRSGPARRSPPPNRTTRRGGSELPSSWLASPKIVSKKCGTSLPRPGANSLVGYVAISSDAWACVLLVTTTSRRRPITPEYSSVHHSTQHLFRDDDAYRWVQPKRAARFDEGMYCRTARGLVRRRHRVEQRRRRPHHAMHTGQHIYRTGVHALRVIVCLSTAVMLVRGDDSFDQTVEAFSWLLR